jgi:hypothetical protein
MKSLDEATELQAATASPRERRNFLSIALGLALGFTQSKPAHAEVLDKVKASSPAQALDMIIIMKVQKAPKDCF